MKKLLFINACIRGEKSRTLGLCRLYIDKFLDAQNLLGEVFAVEEVDLEKEFVSGNLVPQTAGVLNAREPLVNGQKWEDPMFGYARQFVEADHIVIGAPFWDLNFPAVLRIYLERISVPDLTYVYDEQGIPHGKSRIRGGAYIMTAGGPTEGMNYGYEYINGLFKNLFTLPELKLYKAEMIDVYGVDSEAVLEETRKQIIGDLEQEADSLKAAEEKKKEELLKQEALKKPFVCINYKGVKPDNPRGSKEALTERILDKIIEMNEFVIPDELSDEIEYIYKGNIQSLRYQNMFGAGKLADEGIDYEALYQEVEADVTRDFKVEKILKSVILQENIDCSFEELEEEAKKMAARENTTLEFVRKFIGDDYALLKTDILKRKARDFLYESAEL